jgi:LAO/AO transport system kinase
LIDADQTAKQNAGHVALDLPRISATPNRDRRRTLSRQQYVDGILNGDSIILAQAITLIESSREDDRLLAEQILEDCLPASGNSIRVAISGVPGAGKSSIIEALGRHLICDLGQKVAVLAVDPSSELSGGSILGDKTRMTWLASSDLAFIRPSPSRGSFGGIAQHTREAMLLCEAGGYRNILIETVGVGQSETAVHNMVDFFVLVMLAGAGDELQGIKRGIMELADLAVVNKADGANVVAAERARAETEHALHFFPTSTSGWTPRALTCSALTGNGITALWNCALEHSTITRANGWFDRTRCEQKRRWLQEILNQGLRKLFDAHPAVQQQIGALENEVLSGQSTPFRAARILLDLYSDPQSET